MPSSPRAASPGSPRGKKKGLEDSGVPSRSFTDPLREQAAVRIQARERGRQARHERDALRARREQEKREAALRAAPKPRRVYPDSAIHQSFRYVLAPFGEGSPQCTYLKEEVWPRLLPSLERLLTRIAAANLAHQNANRQRRVAAARPPPPRPPDQSLVGDALTPDWDRYQGELDAEPEAAAGTAAPSSAAAPTTATSTDTSVLAHERESLWAPVPHLPQQSPLDNLGMEPLRWLAQDLHRRSKTYARRQQQAQAASKGRQQRPPASQGQQQKHAQHRSGAPRGRRLSGADAARPELRTRSGTLR
eukprot:TRINITY_DN7743_c0_g1_i1.p1 TRINITY_DN7743_c0_g1~~TRINITY_DN7743_c0_g1_i1.p1  ORF type:complete len:331 (+),score=80.70 TRINITY_DN7743_c0_g1_i1:79-993(+)